MTIGEKIKELRRKNDLTQEKLADYLCVSSQAVSKWECGLACPDLSLIGPLTKLLKVSSDELLGLDSKEGDTKEKELKKAYEETYKTGDFSERIRISREAVREYPGNMRWLNNYAWDVWCGACGAICILDDAAFEAEREKAIGMFKTIIENTDEDDVKAHAICGIVQCLCGKGCREEARQYVELFPEAKVDPHEKDRLLAKCLEGDEQIRYQQKNLEKKIADLVNTLIWSDARGNSEKCDVAEKIILAMIPDGNYLYYHTALLDIQLWRAERAAIEEQNDLCIEHLKKVLYHAKELDRIDHDLPGEYSYTAPLFDHLTVNTADWYRTGNSTYVEDAKDWLKVRKVFNNLYSREDFPPELVWDWEN